jgi:hypothetical protein
MWWWYQRLVHIKMFLLPERNTHSSAGISKNRCVVSSDISSFSMS